jgi:hypothetical protein
MLQNHFRWDTWECDKTIGAHTHRQGLSVKRVLSLITAYMSYHKSNHHLVQYSWWHRALMEALCCPLRREQSSQPPHISVISGEGPRSRRYGGFLCNPVMMTMMMIIIFYLFPSNGTLVNETDRGKNRSSRGKTCPSATLSTTNLTWTDPGSNPGLRSGMPAANRLSHGTA